jgi:hypothetical protein
MEEDTENMAIEDEIKRLVRDIEAMDTIFNEPKNLLDGLKDSYGSKNYANILENGKKVLDIMRQPTQNYLKVGTAFSISAAAEWVTVLEDSGVNTSEASDLISKARDEFSDGKYDKAYKFIEELGEMFPKLEEEQKEVAGDSIASTEQLIEEAKGIDAIVHGAERALQQAKNALEAQNYLDVAKFIREAREGAEYAKEKRIQTVSDTLLFTRSVIDESRDVGVDTSEPDSLYEEAQEAFKNEEYKKCSELNKQAEEKALQLQDEHIQKVIALKEKRAELLEKKASMEQADTGVLAEEGPSQEVAEKEEQEELCPTCGAEMRYVEKYNRHWCRDCKKYGPKK